MDIDALTLQEILDLHKEWVDGKPGGIRANLSGRDLSGARLDGAELQKAHLERICLDGARLRGASLERANLNIAGLYRADLGGASLDNAGLYRAHLEEACLEGARLYGADLQNACLVDARLRNADLREANLKSADLRRADLCCALGLEAFIFAGPIVSRIDLVQWDMKNDILLCGCFKGTLEEFRAQVEIKRRDNPEDLIAYRAMIRFCEETRVKREER